MIKQTHNLVIDKKYFFSFQADIASLNGVYSVSSILNYEEVEAILSDPVQDIYLAVNKLDIYIAQQLNTKFRNEVYYKLQSVLDPQKVFYVPDSLLLDYPLDDFKEMLQYMFLCEVGIINDPKELEAAVPLINQAIWNTLGIDPITMISSYGKTYLSPTVIADHTRTRNLNKETSTVYTQLADLRRENASLKEKVGKYEMIIIDLYNNKGTVIPEKTLNPVIASFVYSQGAFALRSTIWDTTKIHTISTWMIAKTTDFLLPLVNETSTTQLCLANFNKPDMAPGKYYAKLKYGALAPGETDLTYSEWSPTVSFEVIS